MIHLIFLIACLGLVGLGQTVALLILPQVKGWQERRKLQLTTLSMPLWVIGLFAFTMLPADFSVFSLAHLTHSIQNHPDELLTFGAFGLLFVPLVLTFLISMVRLVWLYIYVLRHTWQAPTKLSQDLLLNSPPFHMYTLPTIRIWRSTHSFAFNLPRLRGLTPSIIVFSTQIITQLNKEELKAVLAHEVAHLQHQDFWVNWLGCWWRDAFFYLPWGWHILGLIHKEQELTCDERVVKQGGLPMALALADALLKVWEETLERSKGTAKINSNNIIHKGPTNYQAPGLAKSNDAVGLSLTEQRVDRLIKLGETIVAHNATNEDFFLSNWRTNWLLISGMAVWLVLLESIHLIMMPIGCVT